MSRTRQATIAVLAVLVVSVVALAGVMYTGSVHAEVEDGFNVADYDANGNGYIEREEVFAAINDYFDGEITRAQVFEVIDFYFDDTPVPVPTPTPEPAPPEHDPPRPEEPTLSEMIDAEVEDGFNVADYDANGNGYIEREEVFAAINDYFDGEITRAQVFEVIDFYFDDTPVPVPTPTPEPAPPEHDPPRPEEPTLSEMIEQVRPSVVKIWNGGQGSGVIFDTVGETAYILTVSHAVDDRTEEISVRVEDTTYYTATLLRRDPVRDLAVVTICCGEFTAAAFGDYDNVQVGDDLIVMGYPRGYTLFGAASATKGIVSNKLYSPSRDILSLQTDAATNPGNSGGPYLTMAGEVVAVAYSGYFDSGGPHFGIAESTISQHMSDLRTPGGEAIFENISGRLYHYPDSPGYTVAVFSIGFTGAADLEVEADFINPYAYADHAWSHGLAVRIDPDLTDDEDLPYLAFVISGSWWVIYRVDWWMDTGSFVLLAAETADTIQTGANARNHLKVSANGPVGDFYINGVLVRGSLDLSSANHAGDIAALEGFHLDAERHGAVTLFENLRGKVLE